MKRNYESGSVNKPKQHHNYKVDIPFSEQEKKEFIQFIKETGKSRGPWVRVLILKAIATEKKALAEVSHD